MAAVASLMDAAVARAKEAGVLDVQLDEGARALFLARRHLTNARFLQRSLHTVLRRRMLCQRRGARRAAARAIDAS